MKGIKGAASSLFSCGCPAGATAARCGPHAPLGLMNSLFPLQWQQDGRSSRAHVTTLRSAAPTAVQPSQLNSAVWNCVSDTLKTRREPPPSPTKSSSELRRVDPLFASVQMHCSHVFLPHQICSYRQKLKGGKMTAQVEDRVEKTKER